VIEAIPENIELKKATFREVDMLAPPNAIIASNTSSISITELGSATKLQRELDPKFHPHPRLKQMVKPTC
ncbi:3-hydroxyacyl-CoA dehydrogenase, partial [Candidatus Bathyarchaeota archaeon]|nr:3-hydroxyacyl-CoA dehydrogenase [Candidatus Bathyarchaeota archaeon]